MTLAETSTIIGSAVAVTTCILGVVKFWITQNNRDIEQLVGTARADLLRAIGANMERQFRKLDKATYVTLDYRMDGDAQCLRIPLAYDRVTECLQGMRLQLVDHTEKETVYSISTLGYHSMIRLNWHYHQEMEALQVVRGHVVDITTGRRYEPGEIWLIEPGIRHSADFDNAYCLCSVRPPLPFAAMSPIKLDGIESVYDTHAPNQ